MYINNIYIFTKNEEELEILTQIIYSQEIGMDFRIEKCAIFIMKNEKQWKVWNCPIRKLEWQAWVMW